MTEAAFHTVWIPLQERFYRIAFYILEDSADASDAVQDLYLKLWSLRDSLDIVKEPAAYGSMLMRNLCIDRIRRRKPSAPLTEVTLEKAPPDEDLEQRESLSMVSRAIAKLPPGQQKLLRLRVLKGLTYEEISKITGLSSLNIRVQVSQARKKLKNEKLR